MVGCLTLSDLQSCVLDQLVVVEDRIVEGIEMRLAMRPQVTGRVGTDPSKYIQFLFWNFPQTARVVMLGGSSELEEDVGQIRQNLPSGIGCTRSKGPCADTSENGAGPGECQSQSGTSRRLN